MADQSSHEEIRRLFDLAMDAPSGDERDALLERECRNDAELKQRIIAMIAAAEDEQFLGAITAEAETHYHSSVHSQEQGGQVIGRYRLLELIGEGGFGVVWAAEQKEPVKRRVALKVIKLGMDTKQVIARFEAERQALAMMDHPNIAKVLDAGATETGRPYFVMELVKGVPILDYCDKEKLDTKSRLQLFTQVCNAIQHAHQKGIIHRDIKPTNVLVTLHDGTPVPKVIDFGIAKATNAELTEKTIYTQHRQMVGTPAYMSPEQAEMSGLDIDTRSDIYSLGVLLYELLTGTTPFDTKSLMEAGYVEMMRIIRETEPHKPSTRLSSLGNTATQTASLRRADVKKLGLLLRGDLDWIVMKCLEKDRTRRYETANGLAMDIRRHMNDEPVVAGPPSASYKLKKLVRRNKSAVTAAAAVFIVLTLGIVGTSWGMAWALDERARVSAQNQQAIEALEQVTDEHAEAVVDESHEATAVPFTAADEGAEVETLARTAVNLVRSLDASNKAAKRELARANEIKRLITEMLRSVQPTVAQGTDTTLLAGILDGVSARLADGEIEDELVEAELHLLVGDVYRILGMYPEAEEHLPKATKTFRRVLGEESENTLKCVHSLALLYQFQGRYAEAEANLLKVLGTVRRRQDEEKPYALGIAANLANLYLDWGRYGEAEAVCLETLPDMRRVLGTEHENTLKCQYFLSQIYIEQARYAEAEPLCLETLDIRRRLLGEEHPDTSHSRFSLARLRSQQGRQAEAEALHRENLEIQRRVLGPEHEGTLNTMASLAMVLRRQGKLHAAEELEKQILEVYQSTHGPEHPATLGATNNLALTYRAMRRYEEAAQLFEEILPIERRVLGEDHVWTLGCLTNLGLTYFDMGRFEDAARMFAMSLPRKRQVFGAQHPWTHRAMTGLAKAYDALGQRDDALPLWRELLDLQTAGAESPDADAQTLNNAAWNLLTHEYEELHDAPRAHEFAERACSLEEGRGGEKLWMYLDTLALAQHMTGDTAAAIETQKRAIALMPSPDADPEMRERLAEYEAALRATNAVSVDN